MEKAGRNMQNTEENERLCMCALGTIFGFKPAIALALIENLGSAAAVFDLSEEDKDRIIDRYSPFREQLCRKSLDKAGEDLARAAAAGGRFIHIRDSAYPPLLRECEDAPVGLWYKGATPPEEVFGRMDPIAIVGTRDISPYGREWCGRIVRAMAAGGSRPTIVSGLALGTDVCAHQEALDCGLPTIAVMATGIDGVYPWRHNAVAQRIAASKDCALVTDYPPGTAPVPLNFLRRNRIIAGMSRATVLIESKVRGGGMVTANLSFSYSRDTYALTGRADDIRSQGCNRLVRARVAEAITDCDSLMDSLGLKKAASGKENAVTLESRLRQSGLPADRVGRAAQVLLAIRGCRGITLDELTRITGLPYRETSAIVSKLECDGMVKVDMLQRCTINI